MIRWIRTSRLSITNSLTLGVQVEELEDENFKLRRELAAERVELAALRAAAPPPPTTSPPHVHCRVTKDGSPHLGARFGVDGAPLMDAAPSSFSPLPPHPPHGDASPPSNGHSPPNRSASSTQKCAPTFDFDTANHPSTFPPSIATHGGAASPQQKRAPAWGLPTTSVHRTLPAPPTSAQLDNMIQVRTLQGRS